MFDPNFDPLSRLEQHGNLIKQLAHSHNSATELHKQLVDHVNQLIAAVNQQDLQINELHDRLRLLEVARQYEDTTKIN
jgi:hypothetical protein